MVAEKGSGALRTTFALGAAAGNQPTIVAMAGAASANAVPQTATARLRGGDVDAVSRQLNAAKDAFVGKYTSQGGQVQHRRDA